MKLAFAFAASMLIASTLLACAGWLVSTRSSRLRHWPAFWAALLIAGLTVPVLGQLYAMFSASIPAYVFDVPYVHAPINAIEWLVNEPSSSLPKSADTVRDTLVTTLGGVYLSGVLVLLMRLIIGRRRARAIATRADAITHSNGVRIWITTQNTSPFALAAIGKSGTSKIVIPQTLMQQLSSVEISDIVEHELSHLRRRDDECGLLLRVVLACCWISPFAHLLFARWINSAEIQCDSAVTLNRIAEHRRAYAETLLKAFRITANRVLQYPAASFSTRRLRSEKMRIQHLLTGNTPTFKQFRHYLALVTLAVAASLSGAMVLAPVSNADATSEIESLASKTALIVNGRLVSPYGSVGDPFARGEKTMHHGVDVVAGIGTPIYAPADGVVIVATDLHEEKSAYGKVVIIETDGKLRILLAHLDSYFVKPGQRISRGARIATVGNTGRSTGPHVHIETFAAGERVDPATVLPLPESQQI